MVDNKRKQAITDKLNENLATNNVILIVPLTHPTHHQQLVDCLEDSDGTK